MHAIQFGSASALQYGVFHPALARPARPAGVVICPGLGNEYMRAHRAYVQLAASLAGAGFPVFRYDHVGTGDSAGELDETTLADLREGLDLAIEELLAMADLPRVAIVGHRLGGWLALDAATRHECRSLVLWDPVIDGDAYVRLLFDESDSTGVDGDSLWVHGFPWSRQLIDAMRAEVRMSAQPPRRQRVLALLSNPLADEDQVRRALGETREIVVAAGSSPGGRDLLRTGPLVHASAAIQAITPFLLAGA